MRLGRKGFSLVEVIVSLAIMTIVAGSIGAFMVAGNNSYMRGNREVTIQEEAQLTANQIIDLIIDVKKGITYTASGDPTNGNAELCLYNAEGETAYKLEWQGGDVNKIFLYEAESVLDASNNSITANFDNSQANLLAEYVTNFVVEIPDDLEKDRSVVLKMSFAYETQSYEVNEKIQLRNAFQADGTIFRWLSLTISPYPTASVLQDDYLTFSYTLTGDETAVKQGVTWSVKASNGGALDTASGIGRGTYIDSDGVLYCSGNEDVTDTSKDYETGHYLAVTCSAVGASVEPVTTYVTVQAHRIDSITITPAEVELERKEKQDFVCTMTGNRYYIAMGVDWSVEYVRDSMKGQNIKSNYNAPIKENDASSYTLTLEVGEKEEMGTRILQVVATPKAPADTWSTIDEESRKGYVTVSTVRGQYTADLILETLQTYSYTGKDNQSHLGYKIDLQCLTSYADYTSGKGYPKVEWSVVASGTGSTDGYEFITYSGSSTADSRYLNTLGCTSNVDTWVTVQAKVQLSDYDYAYPQITVRIPNLSTVKESDSPYIQSEQFVLYRNDTIKCRLMNYDQSKMDDVVWKIEQYFTDDQNPNAVGQNLTKDMEDDEKRPVGFSHNGTANSIGEWGGWDEHDIPVEECGMEGAKSLSRMVFDSTTGEYAYIGAKWYLDWSKSFNFYVYAMDKNTGKVIAEAEIYIPQCEILFPENKRYIEIVQDDPNLIKEADGKTNGGWGNHALYDWKMNVTVYGFTTGSEDDGKLCRSNPNLSLFAVLSGNTNAESKVGTNLGQDKGNYLTFYIANDEPTETLMISFMDERAISIDRVLTVYWTHTWDGTYQSES